MKKFQVFGTNSPAESQRERDHKAIARRAAAEGFVLLKNDGALPLKNNCVALYGPGSRMTVKGGSGSGDVRERHSVTIEEGLKNAGITFPTTLWMDRFELAYRESMESWRRGVEDKIKGFSPIQSMKMFDVIHAHPQPNPACTPVLPDELTDETDTAIYVLSRQAGEGGDRRYEKGDYLLSDTETESLKCLSAHHKTLILVLNCGSVVDLSILEETRIDAVLFYAQGGMEGGNALADVLTGKVNPSGRLTDTWALHYDDYPCADTFGCRNGDLEQEDYREDIYVGYRYFDSFGVKPRYSFGYGLSYTSFSLAATDIQVQGAEVTMHVRVQNIGNTPGREVVQLYLQKPQGRLDCERKSLVAFGKTGQMEPGQTKELSLRFDIRDLAVYDEGKAAFLLPAGEYGLLLGSNAEDIHPCAVLTVREEMTVEAAQPIHPQARTFETLRPSVPAVAYDAALPRFPVEIPDGDRTRTQAPDTAPAKITTLLAKLRDSEKIQLVVGGGYGLSGYNNIMGAAGRTCTGLLKKVFPISSWQMALPD